MKEKNYFQNNIFMSFDTGKFKYLWEGYLKAVYETGWYDTNNPMLPYIIYYNEKHAGGRRLAETFLLEAIAFKFTEEVE